jgi:hypothetical protein
MIFWIINLLIFSTWGFIAVLVERGKKKRK